MYLYLKKITNILPAIIIILGGLVFSHYVSAETCTISLIWGWPDGVDRDATQPQPGPLKFLDQVVEKAQFRNCEGNGGRKARVIFSGENTSPTVKDQDITSNYLEINNKVSVKNLQTYSFRAFVNESAGALVSQRQSQTLSVAIGGGVGGACSVRADCGSEVSPNTGLRPFCNTDFGRCDECGVVHNSIAADTEVRCSDSKKTCVAGKCVDSRVQGGTKDTGSPSSGPSSSTPGGSYNFEIQPYGPKDFTELINTIAKWIFNLSIPIAVIMIIFAGIKMLISQGNPGEFDKAKQALFKIVIGLAVIFIGKGFITLIKSILELK